VSANPEFDAFASDYDAALNQGLKFSGETKEYFAEGRTRWFRQTLGDRFKPNARCLDYGCGTGTATPYLMQTLQLQSLVGVDLSTESLARATQQHALPNVQFDTLASLNDKRDEFDLAYCNGVFHHIPITERESCIAAIYQAMKPGGIFAFWENNAWNPIVRFMMSRVPFDADAIVLFPHEARHLARNAGFEVLRTDYLFVFPGLLKMLRGLEPMLSKLPFGGQYQVLCRKPV
jgi:SAM-dependent methyltransferase